MSPLKTFKHARKWLARALGAVLLISGLGGSASAQTTVPLYGMFQTNFQHAGTSSNPYTQITATVTFTQPTGSAVTIPMFWDGASTWRVRFSPWLPGTWTWTIGSANLGLNNKSGNFLCTPSANKGSITTMANAPYHFAYQNGTPFWWFGETGWHSFGTNAAENLTRAAVLHYFDVRASQGFNALHSAILSANDGGPGFGSIAAETLNPAHWQEVDLRLDYLNQKGIVGGLVLAWSEQAGSWYDFSAAARLRYARYIVARYSAYNVYFLVAAEWGLWDNGTNEAMQVFREIGNQMVSDDPHHRMVGIHAHITQADPFTQSEVFADDAWCSFGDYQQYFGGVSGLTPATDASRDNLRNRLLAARDHGKPVLNTEYAYYLRDSNGDGIVDKENSHNREEFRRATWVLTMAGGYFVTGFGTTYRGGLSDPGPFNPDNPKNDVAEDDMKKVRDFFAPIEWWTLNPNDSLVTGAGYHYCLAAPGQTYVVYSSGTTSASLSLGGVTPATYRVQRYDPRTGAYAGLGNYTGPGPILLGSPDTQDWIYLVRNTGGSALAPVAYWRLDEKTGAVAGDSSGHLNHGTLVNDPAWTSGQVGEALAFDGADDYVEAGNSSGLHLVGSMSLATWVRPEAWATNAEYSFISKWGGATDPGWALRKMANTDRFEIAVSDAATYTASRRSATVLTPGKWYHLAGVYDATARTLDLYINGTLDNGALSGTVPALQRDSSQNVNIGRYATGNGSFSGALDEVFAYNRALEASEVTALYTGEGTPSGLSAPSDLKATAIPAGR